MSDPNDLATNQISPETEGEFDPYSRVANPRISIMGMQGVQHVPGTFGLPAPPPNALGARQRPVLPETPDMAKKGGPTPWLNPKAKPPAPETPDVDVKPYGGVLPVSPQEQALSVSPILYGKTPPEKPRSRTVPEIAADLHARGQGALTNLGVSGGRITGPAPETDEMLARTIAHEVSHSIASRGGDAGDWYTGSVDKAMNVAGLIHPEVAVDPQGQTAYKLGLAVTSQGEQVPSNVRLADQVFDYFKQNGRFPENVAVKATEPVNNNFKKLNALIDQGGMAGLQKFLHTQFTVGDLEKMGYDIGGENVKTKVYGSAILGPKIGQGFYQNLSGNYDPVTMDLWFMRGWNRLTGNLVGQQDPVALAKTKQRYVNALGKDAPGNDADLLANAQLDSATHELDFKNDRAAYDSGEKVKSERTLAAQRLVQGMAGVNQQPTSGGQRDWMRSVVNRAREILAENGHHITNADLQALWWYPEKELYAKLGGEESEGLNVNYSSALQDLARQKGFSEDDIQRAVKGQ